jgi:hypothetical protein
MAKVLVNEYKELGVKLYTNDAAQFIQDKCFEMTNRGNIYFTVMPTSNCQLAAVGSFYTLLSHPKKLEVFKLLASLLGQNVMLIDIQLTYAARVDELVTEAKTPVILRTPYLSTNGSNMVMFLVDIRTLRD